MSTKNRPLVQYEFWYGAMLFCLEVYMDKYTIYTQGLGRHLVIAKENIKWFYDRLKGESFNIPLEYRICIMKMLTKYIPYLTVKKSC